MARLTNRYEFMYFVECINGNPNGDPDAGNSPHGSTGYAWFDFRCSDQEENTQLCTDCKQDDPRNQIIVQQSTNINKFIALAHEEVGSSFDKKLVAEKK